MLRTLSQTRDWSPVYRLASIGAFTLVTIITARISIPLEPVPFTMQVLAVLLAGMTLGSRDGALSQILYVGMIVVNLPVAAEGMGQAALLGGTAGYLIGFIPAAFVAGLLVERGAARMWQRWLAGVVGVGVIYLFGVTWLAHFYNMDLSAAWTAGAVPFIPFDLVKAVIAAALTEGGRRILSRQPDANL